MKWLNSITGSKQVQIVKKPDWNCNKLKNQSFAVQFAVHNQFGLRPTQAGLKSSMTGSIIFYTFSAIRMTPR